MFSSFGLVAVIVKLRPETPAPGQQIARVTPHSAHAPAVAAPPVAVAPAADTGPLAAEFAALRGKDLGERVAFWSEFLTHKSKAQRALALIGDAPAIEDTAPLLPGKYDCTTFVETVAALSRSDRSEEFYPNLLSIRYRDGKPTYLSRNHFPEADWIPNNKRIGVLRDITDSVAEVAKVDHQIARKTIDRAKWLAKQETQGKVSRGLASVSDREIQQASVPFIPLEAVSAAEARIPNGAILNIVRQDRANKPVLITHQGFVVQRDGKTWFRHASVGGSIKTVLLSEYLRELEEKAREKNWPLAGINLNELGRSGRF